MSLVVPDFSEAEHAVVAELVQQRYGKPVVLELADSEMKLDPVSDEMTVCPTLYWRERGAQFVVFKVSQGKYRCQFFYTDSDQYGTGHDGYTDLRRCVLTLLRVQSDHESQSAGVSSGATAVDQLTNTDSDEYHGPLVI